MLGLNKPKAKSALEEQIGYLKERINESKKYVEYNERQILRAQEELNKKPLEIEAFEIMIDNLIIANKG